MRLLLLGFYPIKRVIVRCWDALMFRKHRPKYQVWEVDVLHSECGPHCGREAMAPIFTHHATGTCCHKPYSSTKQQIVCPYCAGSGNVRCAETRMSTGETKITASMCTMCGGVGSRQFDGE